ncbi:hypothetical protein TNCV_1533831 [Trichonephila clavipes]|nr:hypothetical protein TNCV_1533831 [Trichonephila clavipes]
MTIHRRLIERNLRSCRPLRKMLLTSVHCRAIVFSDESHFQLCPDSNRRRVWRRLGQRADPAFTIARHTSPQTGVN